MPTSLGTLPIRAIASRGRRRWCRRRRRQRGLAALHRRDGGRDAALAGFLQRFLGCALTGETSEHALLYGIAEGGNGKSVFVNSVRGIFGDYAAVAAPDLLSQSAVRRPAKGGAETAQSTEIAMLAGARLVTASETKEGRIWADGRLKLLTGGDSVTAWFLKRDHFTFTPHFKLIVVGSHMPMLRTVDAAIRWRLCVVPFAKQPAVPDGSWPPNCGPNGRASCVRWSRAVSPGRPIDLGAADGKPGSGLHRPAAIAAASDAYLDSHHIVDQLLAE